MNASCLELCSDKGQRHTSIHFSKHVPFIYIPRTSSLAKRQQSAGAGSYYAVSLLKTIIWPWANLLKAQSVNNIS